MQDEIKGTLNLGGYIYLDWDDDFLKWSQKYPYNCINNLIAPKANVWIPDLAILNGQEVQWLLNQKLGKIWLRQDGLVQYTPPFHLAFHCEPDITFFPFDEQECIVRVDSWNYPTYLQSLHLLPRRSFIKLENIWTTNKQWKVVGNLSRIYRYLSGKETYDSAIFILKIRRDKKFYVSTILLPAAATSVIQLSSYMFPIEQRMGTLVSLASQIAFAIQQVTICIDLYQGLHVDFLCNFKL